MGFPAMNSPCRIKTIRKMESFLRSFFFFQVMFTMVGLRYGLLLLDVGTQFTGHFKLLIINPLKPNDPYRGCTAPLTSKRCIIYIFI